MHLLEDGRASVCLLFLIVSHVASGSASPNDSGFVLRSLLAPGAPHAAVRRAALGARQRLGQPGCQRVFSEFTDATGRTLQERLDVLGQTAASYLGLILFADGKRLQACGDPIIFAVTEPGSRVVHICGRQFAVAHDQDATRTEAFLIHEELHSLGLRENPPSSREITARVLARCYP